MSKSWIPANAICLTCGTTKENPSNAFCINDHDDWLEKGDGVELYARAKKVFGKSTDQIYEAIKNGTDLKTKKEMIDQEITKNRHLGPLVLLLKNKLKKKDLAKLFAKIEKVANREGYELVSIGKQAYAKTFKGIDIVSGEIMKGIILLKAYGNFPKKFLGNKLNVFLLEYSWRTNNYILFIRYHKHYPDFNYHNPMPFYDDYIGKEFEEDEW